MIEVIKRIVAIIITIGLCFVPVSCSNKNVLVTGQFSDVESIENTEIFVRFLGNRDEDGYPSAKIYHLFEYINGVYGFSMYK